MGYLDNSTVTVDAILTNKGRQILAAGGQLNITKFALADDEIDYDLWNPSHTLGSNYYGAVIEGMPILEASPDETQMMRYKLITLPKDVSGIPVIAVNPGTISLTTLASSQTVTPTTTNMPTANNTLGYTAILSDDTVATLEVAAGGQLGGRTRTTPAGTMSTTASGTAMATLAAQNASISATNFLDDEVNGITTAGSTITRVGMSFIVKPKETTTAKSALLTIIANETGGFKTVTINVAANYPVAEVR